MKRPDLALWLKWHYWSVLRWLPFGRRLWRWTDDTVDRWHESQPGATMHREQLRDALRARSRERRLGDARLVRVYTLRARAILDRLKAQRERP